MGIPGNQLCWGLLRFVRAGGPSRSLIQARQNPYRLAPDLSSKVPVKSDRPTGQLKRRNPWLKVSSVRSLPLKHPLKTNTTRVSADDNARTQTSKSGERSSGRRYIQIVRKSKSSEVSD